MSEDMPPFLMDPSELDPQEMLSLMLASLSGKCGRCSTAFDQEDDQLERCPRCGCPVISTGPKPKYADIDEKYLVSLSKGVNRTIPWTVVLGLVWVFIAIGLPIRQLWDWIATIQSHTSIGVFWGLGAILHSFGFVGWRRLSARNEFRSRVSGIQAVGSLTVIGPIGDGSMSRVVMCLSFMLLIAGYCTFTFLGVQWPRDATHAAVAVSGIVYLAIFFMTNIELQDLSAMLLDQKAQRSARRAEQGMGILICSGVVAAPLHAMFIDSRPFGMQMGWLPDVLAIAYVAVWYLASFHVLRLYLTAQLRLRHTIGVVMHRRSATPDAVFGEERWMIPG